ncbi:MAG TPA: type I methionyl aminopeptidase [Spirochaetota bacterium]|nr:type I methionyl aminopeptidase [Spirochaetota bacterium]HPJ35548.1 type I methionyl aminopeptidase [Spirochaetota bacterium]
MRKLHRNDLCWCGSGKKYKKCHMESDALEGAKTQLKKPPKGIIIKTPEQIEKIRKASILTRDILDMVSEKIGEGITTDEINEWVHEYTISRGAKPAPLGYNGFPKSVCTSINNVICHGIPDETVLKNGDIINVDVTSIVDGYYGDASRMFIIGEASETAKKLVRVAKECMDLGIQEVRPYNDFGRIGQVIQKHATDNGFTVVKDYGGHGIGDKFHEEPHVHHYDNGLRGLQMFPGMVFTIEPMINEGKFQTGLLGDGWTAVTVDGLLSAQWEHTVCVTDSGVEILTE